MEKDAGEKCCEGMKGVWSEAYGQLFADIQVDNLLFMYQPTIWSHEFIKSIVCNFQVTLYSSQYYGASVVSHY